MYVMVTLIDIGSCQTNAKNQRQDEQQEDPPTIKRKRYKLGRLADYNL